MYEDSFSEQMKLKWNLTKVSNDPLIYVIINNHLQTSLLLDSLSMPMRIH
jgi:hypothetical protein